MVDRFEFFDEDGYAKAHKTIDGGWVDYDDYVALEKQLLNVQSDLEAGNRPYNQMNALCDMAKQKAKALQALVPEMRTYSLWEPMIKQDISEPKAILTYGDISFEIPYTLMYRMTGWIYIGSSGDLAINNGSDLVKKAFDFLSKQMAWDSLPPTQEMIEFYGKKECKRPELLDFDQAESIWCSEEEYIKTRR